MTADIIIVLAVLVVTVVLFVTERLPVDLVALIAMGLLLISGVITPAQGLAGFSNTATITVGSMFIMSEGLVKTGVASFLGSVAKRVFMRGFWFGIISIMLIAGLLSAFINNTPVVAIFLPILLAVSRETDISASKLLIPLSFASMFGGVCTLIGTSTNIVVSSIAEENGLRAFSMFEFAPLGLIMFVVGTAYLLLFGVRLIPDRRGRGDLVEEFAIGEYLTEIILMPDAASVGKAIRDAPLVHEIDVAILTIYRDDEIIQLPSPDEVLEKGDVLLIRCDIEKIRSLQQREHVEFRPAVRYGDENVAQNKYGLLEVIIEPNSNLAGTTLRKSHFRERFGAIVLALRHRGKLLRETLSDTTLSAGDVLLIEIEKDRIGGLRGSGEFVIISEMEAGEFRRNKIVIAIAIFASVIVLASLNVAPIVVTAVLGAIAMILTGCMSLEEAYQAIEWKIIFLLAGVLSLGIAFEETGAADLLSTKMITYVGSYGLIALLSAFYLLALILTETISNNATAALLAPLAIAAAATLGVSPTPFLIAITFAASASFMTPIGYQTNTMIYGPGQYKFIDFIKVGAPLNIMFWLLATALIPILWSF